MNKSGANLNSGFGVLLKFDRIYENEYDRGVWDEKRLLETGRSGYSASEVEKLAKLATSTHKLRPGLVRKAPNTNQSSALRVKSSCQVVNLTTVTYYLERIRLLQICKGMFQMHIVEEGGGVI